MWSQEVVAALGRNWISTSGWTVLVASTRLATQLVLLGVGSGAERTELTNIGTQRWANNKSLCLMWRKTRSANRGA
ncbi:hypothetical protein BJF84_15910 [Rhodococcus sp. CUA-806]|nr:hypothetical protein BJF84_15910 [Rhodococcus sp. CUA-806]